MARIPSTWRCGTAARCAASSRTRDPGGAAARGGGGVATVETDDVASWIAEYASGGQALFRAGWTNLPAGSGGVVLYGSQGTLHWRQHSRVTESLLLATIDDPEPRVVLEFSPPVNPALDAGGLVMGIFAHYNRNLAESFLRDIRDGAASWSTFGDGLAAQRVLTAIRASLDESRWVDIATV